MLLLCTIATVMISMAGLSILHSHARNLARTQSIETSVQARLAAEGLMQRAIARLRMNPTAKLVIMDQGSALPSAYGEVVPVSETQSEVRIYLYQDSEVPAVVKTIDTAKLAKGT
jgi:Tfp pilus assembly protein PilV